MSHSTRMEYPAVILLQVMIKTREESCTLIPGFILTA
jgi:hypothetical protein